MDVMKELSYEELYNMVKNILESIYGVIIPEVPRHEKGKTYGDISPSGDGCAWSNRILPIYEPKEWEKNPIAGTIHDDAQ